MMKDDMQLLDSAMRQELEQLKKKQNALILAHYYQPRAIQDGADIVGDSFLLSREAQKTSQDMIIVCGVRFMAESVKLLSPHKTVILPDPTAGCPMADSLSASDVIEWREKYPKAAFVCYINTTAAVKAVCDVCCTSANAVEICQRLPQEQIVFLPDPNLAHHIAKALPQKQIIGIGGGCPAHQEVQLSDLARERTEHPDAPVLVHPECSPAVQQKADFVGGTSAILQQARQTQAQHCIIGTERGFLHPLQQACPDKTFSFLNDKLYCEDMKRVDPKHLLDCMRNRTPEITLDPNLQMKALSCLERMLG